jgi:catechol 2,3-dioxygenase-like lactoylglutathione lyase family enzyme
MTSAYHHVGVRVSDMAEAIEFYQGALEARILVEPYEISGEVADRITGVEGARMRMCQIGFDEGFVELFQFETSLPAPASPVPYVHQRVLHFGLQVDDVAGALQRVESHGGQRVFEPRPLGSVTYCYCRDPDGNVIELADGPMSRIVGFVSAREKG